jgi:uncharacterized membrane protein
MATTTTPPQGGGVPGTPTDRLKGEFRNLLGAVGGRALASVRERAGETAGRLTEYAENGGGPGLMAAATGVKDLTEGKSPARALLGAGMNGAKEQVKGLLGRGGGEGGQGGQGKKMKVTNIVESIDVGVPVRAAYDQWTQFRDFPSFMKKVESAEQESDEKLHWRAQILWSHRNWESTIVRQVPDEVIVWRSKGDKGYVDGAVTFHELGPSLTRILLVLEYNPKGFFEQTGNLWRAQGRRARLELKHFRRHVMTQAILQPDEIEGWRGVIEDGEVVKDHQTALEEEQRRDSHEDGEEPGEETPGAETGRGEEPESEYEDRGYDQEDEYEEDGRGEPEDEEEVADEYEDRAEPGEEYEDGAEPEDEDRGEPQNEDADEPVDADEPEQDGDTDDGEVVAAEPTRGPRPVARRRGPAERRAGDPPRTRAAAGRARR